MSVCRPVGVLLGLLCLPCTAQAATVTLRGPSKQYGDKRVVRFAAAPGERNRLTVSQVASDKDVSLHFHDASAPLRARGHCRQVDGHTVRCPETDAEPVIRLGDRADRYRDRVKEDYAPNAYGGGGDDVLRGGLSYPALHGDAGDDILIGGTRQDVLFGGTGRDRLLGGRGRDYLIDDEPAGRRSPDRFDGGGGRDEVDYSRREDDLRIDLGKGTSSTEDRLVDIESLEGGAGDDRLTAPGETSSLRGNDGDDVLRGGKKFDYLRGGAGADDLGGGGGIDQLTGGDGDDVLHGDEDVDGMNGGAGDDVLLSRDDGEGDDVDCGPGDDEVVSDRFEEVEECETLTAFDGGLSVGVLPAVDADSADFAVTCRTSLARGCVGTIALRTFEKDAGGTADFALAPGADGVVSVPLTEAGRAAFEPGVLMSVRVAGPDPVSGDQEVYRYEVRLPRR